MITKKDILKMAKHVTRRGQNIPDRKLIHTERDWLIGLFIFVVLTLVGVSYNVVIFNRINNLESELTSSGSKSLKYKESTVTKVLQYFTDREEQYKRIHGDIVPTVWTEDVETESASDDEGEEVAEGPKDVEASTTPQAVFEEEVVGTEELEVAGENAETDADQNGFSIE